MASHPTISWKSWRPLGNGRYVPSLEIPEEGTSLEAIERDLIEIALRQAGGNQTRAAHLLGISRDTLRYRIKKFDLAKGNTSKPRVRENGVDESPPTAPAL